MRAKKSTMNAFHGRKIHFSGDVSNFFSSPVSIVTVQSSLLTSSRDSDTAVYSSLIELSSLHEQPEVFDWQPDNNYPTV
jgi:hypothetical protein